MANGSGGTDVDVLIIGAGLSGVGAACHLTIKCPWASYTVLEARDAIGGTWDLFRYPGIRSDSDMHTLGYSFRPWDGAKSIADGADILSYINDTADEFGVRDNIRFGHRVLRTDFDSAAARWTVTAERTDTGEEVTFSAGFVFSCSGYYRYDKGYTPEFAGIDDFAGTVVHPQAWPEDLEYADKRVVVIGSGATAITLVPSMAPKAAHVTMLQRSPTYVMSLGTESATVKTARAVLSDKLAGDVLRWYNAVRTQALYRVSKRHPGVVKRVLRFGLERQLPADFDIDTHFTPSYNPWDQRLCVVADGDMFREIRRGKVSVVTDRIARFVPDGIELESGELLAADVVITATGLDLLFLGGIEASVDGEPVDLPSKMSYKGMMLQDVPNFAMAIGYTNASWTLKADLTCDTVCRILNHMHDAGLERCTPRNDGADRVDVVDESLLNLTSGYIARAADRFPKVGTRFPWQVYQSYLRDFWAMRLHGVDDGVVRFDRVSTKAPARA
jgi:monooxygenase